MVDVNRGLDDNGKIRYTVKTPKALTTYLISKTQDGYSRYKVSQDKGKVPAALEGMYTTPDKALKDLLKYIETMPESQAVQRDKKSKESQERKANLNGPKLQSDNQDELQQGLSN